MLKYFSLIICIPVLFVACNSKETSQQSNSSVSPPLTIKCKKFAIPQFTLSYDSNPSEKEVNNLCACLWDKSVGWEKDTMIKISSGKNDEVNSLYKAAFPGRFGKRMKECGGFEL